jgi:chromosome segregation ATPase
METKWMSIDDAVAHTGMSRRTIYRRIKTGEIEARTEDGKRQVCVPADGTAAQESSFGTADDTDFGTQLIEQLKSEVESLREQNASLAHADTELVTQLRAEIAHLRQQNDHLTQLLAMQSKTSGALTEQLDASRLLIEDLRSRPLSLWQRLTRKVASQKRAEALVE